MARPKKLPAGMRQRGTAYYCCFRRGGQVIQRKLSTDFDAAKVILNDLRARADKSDFGIVDNDHPWEELKREFLRWAKQAVRDAGAYERDLRYIEKFQRVQSCKSITQAYVVGYRDWRLSQARGSVAGLDWQKQKGKRVSPRTVNREVGTLVNMLNKAVEWGRIASNPLVGLKPLEAGEPRKQRRALSCEEVQAIMREAPNYLKPVFRLFSVAAIRREELSSLLFSDIDFERRSITIRASIAKSKKAREVLIDDETLGMLADLKAKAKDRQVMTGKGAVRRFSRDHVFVTTRNTSHGDHLLKAFYSVCKRAGIDGAEQGGSVDLHSLRVTSASLMLENGASPKAVQAILGHSTLALTMNVYAKATEKAKREAVAALPFVGRVSPPAGVVSLPNVARAHATNSRAPQAVTA